jgi:nucleoside-diphosphate-sugar epimerase
MKKILITGSKGRVGKDITLELNSKYNIIELEKKNTLNNETFNEVETIIHLAALTPKKDQEYNLKEYMEINVELTKKVLEFSLKNNVRKVIIPVSWSWMFKLSNYQYSKLLQEKIALRYRNQGLNVILLELPEVIHKRYNGIITTIIEKIIGNNETRVDHINIRTIDTNALAKVFERFIEDIEEEGNKLFIDSFKEFDLYENVKEILKNKYPDKIKYLKEGINKIRLPIIKEDKTIKFPEFEYQNNN